MHEGSLGLNRFGWFLPLAALLSACTGPIDDAPVGIKKAALTSVGGLEARFVAHSTWNEGYCGEVTLTNTHESASVSDWSVMLDLQQSSLQNGWSGIFTSSNGSLTVTPEAYNATIVPGASTNFGFCATRYDDSIASVVAVTDDLPGGTCQETPVGSIPTRVEMRVSGVDDFVYLFVNGLRRKVWHYGGGDQGQIIDVTPWFRNGENTVRVQAMNTGGPANYAIELWVDGSLILDESCPTAECASNDAEQGILLNEERIVDLDGLPAAQTVTVSSATPGALFINGQYSGLSTPASLSLPPGDYTFGLGQSDDTPGSYTGRFSEQEVTVGTCPQQVDLTNASTPSTNLTDVAILPVRYTLHGPDDLGVLTDSDIPRMLDQAQDTAEIWVEPFSYGLTDWNVTVLPVADSATMERVGDGAPDTGQFLRDAGLVSLNDQYDMIMFLYSSHQADGSRVDNPPGAIWAGGQHISYDTGWLRAIPLGQPSEGLYHEALHVYEWYNASLHGFYNGVDGLHGAEEHGYVAQQNGEGDWLAFYRPYVRNQVAEVATMRIGEVPDSIPQDPDLFVGLFDTMRYGTDAPSPHTTP